MLWNLLLVLSCLFLQSCTRLWSISEIMIFRRRVKTDVGLEIPPKKEVLVYCPLTPRQKELYKAVVEKTIADLLVPVEAAPGPDTQGLKLRFSPFKSRILWQWEPIGNICLLSFVFCLLSFVFCIWSLVFGLWSLVFGLFFFLLKL